MRRAAIARSLGVICIMLFVALLSVPPLPVGSARPIHLASGLPRYIDEFSVPTPNSGPLAITVDSRGVVWFTESNAGKIARFDPANQSFREYVVPGVGDMWGITVNRAGYVWFTEYTGKGSVNPGGEVVGGGHGRLLRFNPLTGNFTIIDIPTVGSFPMRLVTDSRDRLWFTELLGNKIGLFDSSTNLLTEFSVPTNSSGPADLSFSDVAGILYFTETYAKQIGEFDPTDDKITEYPLGAPNGAQMVSSPVGIALDQHGNIWTADHGGNWIVEFNPSSGGIIKYPTHFPPPDMYPLSIPNGILIDGKGRVWFSEHGGNSVGYIDPDGHQMVEFPIPTGPISTALWIALAPNGDVWFTEWETNKIGVVHSDLQVPLALRLSQHTLTLKAGEQSSVSILSKISEDIGGNGTFQYSWSSYKLADIVVTFSPPYPSLAGLADTTAQAQVRLSSNTDTGNYTLALGIDTGSVRVWTMLQTQVIAASTAGMTSIINQTLLIIGSVVVFAVLVTVLLRIRRRQ